MLYKQHKGTLEVFFMCSRDLKSGREIVLYKQPKGTLEVFFMCYRDLNTAEKCVV